MAAHLEPAYATYAHASLPVTEWLTRRTVILPLFHQMTESDQDRVVDAVVAAADQPLLRDVVPVS
jgi:perosamine synthetase